MVVLKLFLEAVLLATMIEPKVALISGGTRGVGSGIAEMFAKEGYDLVLGFRSNSSAAEKFRECIVQKYGVKVELNSGDIKEEATIANFFQVRHKTIDQKVNCALFLSL